MAKAKKKGMSEEKKVAKDAKIIMFTAVNDYYYSLKTDYPALFKIMDIDGLRTDDFQLDTITIVEKVLRNGNISDKAFKAFQKIIIASVALALGNGSKEAYDRVDKACKEFLNRYSVKEYFSLARQIIFNSQFRYYIQPLFMVLDYMYYADGMIQSCDSTGIIRAPLFCSKEKRSFPIPFCIAASMANVDPLSNPNMTLVAALKNYTMYFIKGNIKLLDETISQEGIAVANFYADNTFLNKFCLNQYPSETSYNNQIYMTLVNIIRNEDSFKSEMILKNFLLLLPPDILTKRSYVFKDAEFDIGLELGFSIEGEEHSSRIYNLKVKEKKITEDGQDYFVIYLSYIFCKDIKRTIPILIDDFFALSAGYNLIDFHAILMLFGLYDLFQYFPEDMICKDEYKALFKPFIPYKDIAAEYLRSHTRKAAEGYHQSKEVKVEAFVRRLPKGQKASEEAKQLAKHYRISLDDNQTMVSGYIKNKTMP